ncbi:MAG: PIN domain-containing protein [Candidatus Diapherotrites archaeon]
MSQTGFKLLLDSSAWLAYFLGASKEVKGYIDTEATLLISSVLSIHEVKKKLLKQGVAKEAQNAIDFMKENSIIIDVSDEIAEKAVNDCIEKKLHTVDSLIYRTAVENNAVVVTGDRDFEGLENVKILK